MKRPLRIERLENRHLMIAEGDSLALIDRELDVSGVLGNVSVEADWGDGVKSALTVTDNRAPARLSVRFDDRFDDRRFFASQEVRQVLQAAVDVVLSKFDDQLAAITPDANNRWELTVNNPSTGVDVTLPGPRIGANEILVFLGTRVYPGSPLGNGGYGAFNIPAVTDRNFLDSVAYRGQLGMKSNPQTDFGVWGGFISVDHSEKWHVGLTTDGLDSDENDLFSTLCHEFTHVLGFGLTGSWDRYVVGNTFVGPRSVQAYGSSVPLEGNRQHWLNGTESNQQETLLDPSIRVGSRKFPTPLDLAGLADMGWGLIPQKVRVSGSHVYGDNQNYEVKTTVIGSRFGSVTTSLQTVVVENVAPTLNPNPIPDQTARVNVPLNLQAPFFRFEDRGFGVSETFQYTIDWGDGSMDQGTARVDRVGSPGVSTIGSFGGIHTYSVASLFRVKVQLVDDDGGKAETSFLVQVSGQPKILLSSDRNEFFEDAGTSAAVVTVTLEDFDFQQESLVQLSSSDMSEASVPPTVRFSVGQRQATFAVDAIDDGRFDGTQGIQIVASVNGLSSSPLALSVLDRETIAVALSTRTVREDAILGTVVLNVRRSDREEQTSIVVDLSSSDPRYATPEPASLVFGVGEFSKDISIRIDDTPGFQGDRQVQLSGAARNFVGSSVELRITDYEPLQWVSEPLELTESDNSSPKVVTLKLPHPIGSAPQSIDLSASLANQLSFPSQVRVEPGQQSVEVTIRPVNDSIVEGRKRINLIASASGFDLTTLLITLNDEDRSMWTNSNNVYDVNGSATLETIDVLIVINALRRFGAGPLPANPPTSLIRYVDVTGDGILTALDALQVINELNRRG